MSDPRKSRFSRRELLLAVPASGIAAAAGLTSIGSPATQVASRRDKRRPQYQADSAEIQTYYRVNRYPGK